MYYCSFVFWGLSIQYCGYFVTMPVYCYVHLLRSTKTQLVSLSDLGATAIRVVPISMLLGYVLPSVAMCLPWTHSGQSRQLAVAFWQNFPAWIAAVQMAVTWFASRRGATLEPGRVDEQQHQQVQSHRRTSTTASQQPDAPPLVTRAQELSTSVRQLYKATAVTSALIHVSGLVPIVLATVWPEGLLSLSPLRPHVAGLQSLQPGTFFLPPRWDSHVQVSGMVEGAWNFLRYDYYIGTAAALLWAAFLRQLALPCQGDAQKQNVVAGGRRRWLGGVGVEQVLMIVTSTAVLGPGFTIVTLMSRREEHLLEGSQKPAISMQQQVRGISEFSK